MPLESEGLQTAFGDVRTQDRLHIKIGRQSDVNRASTGSPYCGVNQPVQSAPTPRLSDRISIALTRLGEAGGDPAFGRNSGLEGLALSHIRQKKRGMRRASFSRPESYFGCGTMRR